MRVSNNMGYEQVKGNIQKNRSDVNDLQNQAATLKRITKPSDDPVGTARTLALRTTGNNTEQFMKNLEMAKGFLNYTESSLGDLTEVISRAKELAISQSSDASANAQTRLAAATEVDQLFNDLVNVGNRRFGERYIFGGYKTTHSPFDFEGSYRGDKGSIKIEVSKGVFTTINLPGDKAFLGRADTLSQVPMDRRGATTPNYPPVPHQPEDVDVRGPASIEEQSEIHGPRTPASERREKEGLDGEKIKPITEDAQGENVFNVFKALSDGLRANDTVAVHDTLERLDGAMEQAILLRAQVGSRVSSIGNTSESLGKNKIDDATLLSSIEDADAFEVFSDITKNENTLKATLQTSGKVIQPSLLDFLR